MWLRTKSASAVGLAVWPEYDYTDSGVLIGYRATQTLSVLVDSLPDAGATIGAAVGAGHNAVRLHDVRLQIGDRDRLLARARKAAVAEARAKAEQYATASGEGAGRGRLDPGGVGSPRVAPTLERAVATQSSGESSTSRSAPVGGPAGDGCGGLDARAQ